MSIKLVMLLGLCYSVVFRTKLERGQIYIFEISGEGLGISLPGP